MYREIAILLVFLTGIQLASSSEKISVCYYTNWAQYRSGSAKFLPEDIDPSLCSHIYYAFAKINLQTHEVEEYEWNDDDMIRRVISLKKQKPSLKVVISIGGWNHEFQPRYSKMVATKETRKIFIDSALVFLKKFSFDGVSFDWEYPGNRGSPAGDKQRFTLLIKETLDAFVKDAMARNTTRYSLTAAVGAGGPVIAKAYEIAKIAKLLDWVNLLSYDLHGSWENVTGCSTSMAGIIPTIPNSLNIWLKGGMPANKITMGLAAYGRTFSLLSAREYGLGDPAVGPGPAGKYTKASGSLSFYEVCSTHWDHKTTWEESKAKSPFFSQDRSWVSIDTVSSIKFKVETLINKQNLRGFSFWALDFDDFGGNFCQQSNYPLLRQAVESLGGSGNKHNHELLSKIGFDYECTASYRWRHIVSLVTWCRQYCVKDQCPKYMCICY